MDWTIDNFSNIEGRQITFDHVELLWSALNERIAIFGSNFAGEAYPFTPAQYSQVAGSYSAYGVLSRLYDHAWWVAGAFMAPETNPADTMQTVRSVYLPGINSPDWLYTNAQPEGALLEQLFNTINAMQYTYSTRTGGSGTYELGAYTITGREERITHGDDCDLDYAAARASLDTNWLNYNWAAVYNLDYPAVRRSNFIRYASEGGGWYQIRGEAMRSELNWTVPSGQKTIEIWGKVTVPTSGLFTGTFEGFGLAGIGWQKLKEYVDTTDTTGTMKYPLENPTSDDDTGYKDWPPWAEPPLSEGTNNLIGWQIPLNYFRVIQKWPFTYLET